MMVQRLAPFLLLPTPRGSPRYRMGMALLRATALLSLAFAVLALPTTTFAATAGVAGMLRGAAWALAFAAPAVWAFVQADRALLAWVDGSPRAPALAAAAGRWQLAWALGAVLWDVALPAAGLPIGTRHLHPWTWPEAAGVPWLALAGAAVAVAVAAPLLLMQGDRLDREFLVRSRWEPAYVSGSPDSPGRWPCKACGIRYTDPRALGPDGRCPACAPAARFGQP